MKSFCVTVLNSFFLSVLSKPIIVIEYCWIKCIIILDKLKHRDGKWKKTCLSLYFIEYCFILLTLNVCHGQTFVELWYLEIHLSDRECFLWNEFKNCSFEWHYIESSAFRQSKLCIYNISTKWLLIKINEI